jgi:hypothetical protein
MDHRSTVVCRLLCGERIRVNIPRQVCRGGCLLVTSYFELSFPAIMPAPVFSGYHASNLRFLELAKRSPCVCSSEMQTPWGLCYEDELDLLQATMPVSWCVWRKMMNCKTLEVFISLFLLSHRHTSSIRGICRFVALWQQKRQPVIVVTLHVMMGWIYRGHCLF